MDREADSYELLARLVGLVTGKFRFRRFLASANTGETLPSGLSDPSSCLVFPG